mmetsp:Transcript_52211/g.77966  ORF Transcript_52211/g.77966 Transcript_52211/m.77966 type:complete len:112 (-) Transcript_52211:140-475(-)
MPQLCRWKMAEEAVQSASSGRPMFPNRFTRSSTISVAVSSQAGTVSMLRSSSQLRSMVHPCGSELVGCVPLEKMGTNRRKGVERGGHGLDVDALHGDKRLSMLSTFDAERE